MLLAITLGLALHMTVMFAVDNKPLAHAAHGGHITNSTRECRMDLHYVTVHSSLSPLQLPPQIGYRVC